MDAITREYLKVKENKQGVTHLKIEVYYSMGGYNGYNVARRGYYLSASPVEKRGCMESYIAFTGSKMLLKEVKRKSKAAEAVAVQIAAGCRGRLIETVLKENKLELTEV